MKIIKVVTSHGRSSYSGKGGHYYSLCKIGSELSKCIDVQVFSFGEKPSPVLNQYKEKLNVKHIPINGIQDLFSFSKNEVVETAFKNADLVHCYDTESLIYGGKLARKYKKPIILTKCGGKNPKSFFPFIKDLILFSSENENYFNAKRKFKNTSTYVIPNRVDHIEPDLNRINELKKTINTGKELKILIIARFVKKYLPAHLQTIRLAKKLRMEGVNCKSILIGHALDHEVIKEIKKIADGNDHIMTNERFCHNAKELIPISDIVVGHGRSIMEAAYFGKILFTPVEQSIYPQIVNKKNYKKFLKYNMTGRWQRKKVDLNFNSIDSIIKDSNNYELFSKNLFDKHFNVKEVTNIYTKIYRNIKYEISLNSLIDWYFLFLNKIFKYLKFK